MARMRVGVCAWVLFCCSTHGAGGASQNSGPVRAAADTPRPSTTLDTRFRAVRAHIAELVSAGNVPSMTVAVAKDGKIIWEEGFGLADVARRVPATPNTTYALASLGKSITATAVMALVDRGLVKLDDPVDTYIAPAKLRVYQGRPSDVTVRSLLEMRGGVPHLWWHAWADETDNPPPIDELMRRYGIVVLPPGQFFLYSNLSYGILQSVVERASGRPFDELVREHVFRPLGMTHSSVRPETRLASFAALPYERGDPKALRYLYSEPLGGAGYRSSAHDLVLYGMYHLGDRATGRSNVMSEPTFRTLHDVAKGTGYQSGWGVAEDAGGYWTLTANGGIVGATSMLRLVPSEDLAVVCLTNAATGDRITDVIAYELIAAVLPRYAKRLVIPEAYATKPYVASAELVGEWAGRLVTPDGSTALRMTFRETGDVVASIGEEPAETVTDLVVELGLLVGSFRGTVPFTDARRRPHNVEIGLARVKDTLVGYARAQTTDQKSFFGLPFYVELSKR
jgi:CubicO group peptidase (beta-lactamase class C family)